MPIRIHKHCRIHPETGDGTRVLTMRYWPRGVRKGSVDVWMRELAPSAELLRWCRAEEKRPGLDREAYAGTWRARYIEEMAHRRALIEDLRRRHQAGETITLLCACHDPERCHRKVLADLVLGHQPLPEART